MSKYGNKKAACDGYTFDSIAEMNRYKELKLLEKAGRIKDLALQPKFELIPKTPGERAVTYAADFQYKEKQKESKLECNDGCRDDECAFRPNSMGVCTKTTEKHIVEDVKSVATARNKEYIIKRKLFKQKYPHIDFREVGT